MNQHTAVTAVAEPQPFALPVRIAAGGCAVAAVALGLALAAPDAAADDFECAEGNARIFFHDTTYTCQSGSVAYGLSPAVVKVCSNSGSTVVVEVQSERKKLRRTVELSNNHCAKFDPKGTTGAIVTVS
ncbi:hypothetical protein AB0H71_29680 [Nocardia sp. NPDC050697]|uniref:hypothetical protein n=1 Tax=Nocardia sp. NPDC050697 TaxID=3155158 RepID=UPI0034013E18